MVVSLLTYICVPKSQWVKILKTFKSQCVMMTTRHGIAFYITIPLWGESIGHRSISIPLIKRPVIRSFDIFVVVNMNKRMNKQSNCRWFETPWLSCGVTVMLHCDSRDVGHHYDDCGFPTRQIWTAVASFIRRFLCNCKNIHISSAAPSVWHKCIVIQSYG